MSQATLDLGIRTKEDLEYLRELQVLQANLVSAVKDFNIESGASLDNIHPIIRKGVTASIRDMRKIAKRLFKYSRARAITVFTLQDIQLFKLVSKSTSVNLDNNILFSAVSRAVNPSIADAIQAAIDIRSA